MNELYFTPLPCLCSISLDTTSRSPETESSMRINNQRHRVIADKWSASSLTPDSHLNLQFLPRAPKRGKVAAKLQRSEGTESQSQLQFEETGCKIVQELERRGSMAHTALSQTACGLPNEAEAGVDRRMIEVEVDENHRYLSVWRVQARNCRLLLEETH